jgi:sRNA-binding carbon storage regulator CsrA
MLNMALRELDYFMIGDSVRVTYKQARNGSVMNISVDAPKNVRILRGVLYEEEMLNHRIMSGEVPAPKDWQPPQKRVNPPKAMDKAEAAKISTLNITLHEGEYFVVGNRVKVIFKKALGDNEMYVGVHAPMDVPIMRWTLYEEYVAGKAAEGEYKFIKLNSVLQREAAERKAEYNKRKGSRAEMNRRIMAGEVEKPEGWQPPRKREDIPELSAVRG